MFPHLKDSDSPAVREALESAQQALQQDRSSDAMRKLRDAANAATSEGSRARAAEIFASVVELSQREERHSIAPARRASPRGGSPRPSARSQHSHVHAAQPAHAQPPRPKPSLPSEGVPVSVASESDSIDDGLSAEFSEAPTTRINSESRRPAHAKGTTEMPKTRLRRALMAIDPLYAERVDYDPSRQEPELPSLAARAAANTTPDIGYLDSAAEEVARPSVDWGDSWLQQEFNATAKELQTDRSSTADSEAVAPSQQDWAHGDALPSFFVNLMHMPGEKDVGLMFVPPGTKPRDGVPAAHLVPLSGQDAERLMEIYGACEVKVE